MSVYSSVIVGTDGSVTAGRAVRRAATVAAGAFSAAALAAALAAFASAVSPSASTTGALHPRLFDGVIHILEPR